MQSQNIEDSYSSYIVSDKPLVDESTVQNVQKKEKEVTLLDEDEIEELFVSALQNIDRGNWQEGEKALLKIISQDSENVEALRELAMLNLLDKKSLH